mgnify:CR=1 FL=1
MCEVSTGFTAGESFVQMHQDRGPTLRGLALPVAGTLSTYTSQVPHGPGQGSRMQASDACYRVRATMSKEALTHARTRPRT